jgi:hypothetical protein
MATFLPAMVTCILLRLACSASISNLPTITMAPAKNDIYKSRLKDFLSKKT